MTTRILLSRGESIGAAEAVRQMHREGRLDNEIHFLSGGLISIAVRVNRPEMVSLLLDLGLDPDETVRGEDGSRMSWGMPLWFTAMAAYSAVSALRDLEEHEPTLARGRPCRSRCRRRGIIIQLWLESDDGRAKRAHRLRRRSGARSSTAPEWQRKQMFRRRTCLLARYRQSLDTQGQPLSHNVQSRRTKSRRHHYSLCSWG